MEEELKIWKELKPMIQKIIREETKSCVRRRKMTVTSAYDAQSGLIGVTEAYGQEIMVPASAAVKSLTVGQSVWVESIYGASNSVAMFPGKMA